MCLWWLRVCLFVTVFGGTCGGLLLTSLQGFLPYFAGDALYLRVCQCRNNYRWFCWCWPWGWSVVKDVSQQECVCIQTQFGVLHNPTWKCLKSTRREGYTIEAALLSCALNHCFTGTINHIQARRTYSRLIVNLIILLLQFHITNAFD